MIRRGASDSKNRLGGRPCAGCGKPIQSGLYCSVCLEKFRERVKSQGKRIEAMKSNDLRKVAENIHEIALMIVISDELNLNVTKLILQRSLPKYKVISTNNPLTAINMLVSRTINLVILDADYNGLDMLRRIRSDDRFGDVPVLMLSGSTRRELVAEIFSLGVQDYLAKPCEPTDIVERVNKILADKAKISSERGDSKTLFNIMLIDDDIFDLRQERETVKKRFPCELMTAQSAVEGMKILENMGADLILVSLNMPFVNGLKFLSLVKENDRLKNIPVIIMSETYDATTLKEVEESAAAGHIKKPVINEDGLSLIEDILRRG